MAHARGAAKRVHAAGKIRDAVMLDGWPISLTHCSGSFKPALLETTQMH
jgi:hypothetical protein